MAEFFDINAFEVDINEVPQVMTEVYQEIASTEMLGAELGTYEYGIAGIHSYDQANLSVYRRISIDGGATWQEVILEPSDTSNVRAVAYQFYKQGISGDLSLVAEARKETATGIMTVHSINVWIKRVK